jgi:uncharacterized sulfatase
MQGHAFLGRFQEPPQPFLYGFRGRMDERHDLIRSVTDGRYVYLRNYMPHKIYGQHIAYMFETPTTAVWKRLFDAGQLNRAQSIFWKEKPAEELYDLAEDPDEVRNLAGSAAHCEVLTRMRGAQQQWAAAIRDVGFLPEGEIHKRSHGDAPYDMGHDPERYPFQRVFETAELASGLEPDALPELNRRTRDPDSAVRYWAVLGIQMRGPAAVEASKDELHRALADESPFVRTAAAEATARYGEGKEVRQALDVLVGLADPAWNDVFTAVAALNALDELGDKTAAVAASLRDLNRTARVPHQRYEPYVPRLLEDLTRRFPE